MILDKIAFVDRLTPEASNSDREAYTAHSGFIGKGGIATSAISINIQPATAETIALAEGIVGKTFRAFTNASGVVETMRLTVSGTSQRFIVRGREDYGYVIGQHYELILAKDGR